MLFSLEYLFNHRIKIYRLITYYLTLLIGTFVALLFSVVFLLCVRAPQKGFVESRPSRLLSSFLFV
jgi:hypothetical protein